MSERQDTPIPSRVFYIDNLRVFLITLVIVHHLAIGFGAPGGWYYVIPATPSFVTATVLSLFVIVNQAFFMSLFFFVSAYFTPRSLEKKGTLRFIYDRLVRLGIPLAVYYFILNPTLAYMGFRFRGERECGYLQFMMREGNLYFGPGPLWFIVALLLFTTAYLLLATVHQRYSVSRFALHYPSNKAVLLFVTLITLIAFTVRLLFPMGVLVFGLQPAFFPLYISFFIFGIQAYRNDWLGQLKDRQARLWFRLALACIIALPVIFELGGVSRGLGGAFRGGFTLQSLVYVLWESLVCIGISMKLLTMFRNRLNVTSPLTGLLSNSAYTVYIIHCFIVITATYLARNWPLPLLLSMLILIPPVVIICFFAAHFIRQAPLLNRVL